jgi:UDP-glucuronate 4-epimerase
VDQPVSLYGATKRANELMAYAYNNLFGMAVTGLRFFTVYGPWGRPDMSYFKFTKNIMEGIPIDVYNHGHHARDFTYIDDIVDGMMRAMKIPVTSDRNTAHGKNSGQAMAKNCRLYNLGNNKPVDLMYFISVLETLIGKKAVITMLPKQPGDIEVTCADIDNTVRELGYAPGTTLEQGLKNFVEWFMHYYGYKK